MHKANDPSNSSAQRAVSPQVDGHLQCTDNARNVGTRHAVSDKATTAPSYEFRGHGMPCPYKWMVICNLWMSGKATTPR